MTDEAVPTLARSWRPRQPWAFQVRHRGRSRFGAVDARGPRAYPARVVDQRSNITDDTADDVADDSAERIADGIAEISAD